MLKNMKIATRLSLAFGLLLVFLLINGGIAFMMIEDLNGEVSTLAEDRMPKVEQANVIIDNISIIARALRNIYIDTSKETQEAELARQTAAATVDIKNQISEMQSTTGSTIKDIEQITAIIAEINSVIATIATAVVQQSAATGEIAGNISQASQGIMEVNENVAQSTLVVAEITQNISEINTEANQVGASSSQVQASAQELSALAARLQTLMGKFKV